MRAVLMLLLASCSTSSPGLSDGWVQNSEPLTGVQAHAQAPTTPVMTLSTTPIVLGSTVEFTVTGATPNATVGVAYSFGGVTPGLCPLVLQGNCLGIGTPTRLILTTGSTDAAGEATWTVAVPPIAPSPNIALQAVDLSTGQVSQALGTSLFLPGTVVGTGDDYDQDGFSIDAGDCADNNAAVFPTANDVSGDAVDSDCDGFDDPNPCPSDPACADGPAHPLHHPQDYSAWSWPKNHRPTETWPVIEPVSHFSTGYFAFTWDESTGEIPNFGAWPEMLTSTEAQDRDLSSFAALPPADLTFSVGTGANQISATDFSGVNPASPDRMRMIDGGHLMNRFELTTVAYADDANVVAEGQIAVMPRHVVFHQAVSGSTQTDAASITLGGDAFAAFGTSTWLVPDKAVTLTDAAGDGWLFVVYDQPDATTTLAYDPLDGVTAVRESTGTAADGVAVSLLAAPLSALGDRELAMYLDPEGVVSVDYTLLDVAGADVGSTLTSPWDDTLGAYVVPLEGLGTAGGPSSPTYDTRPASHNEYSRHRITIDAGTDGPVAVPIAMHSHVHVTWSMTSGVPMFRTLDGVPTGLPVQVSKNWHEGYWDNWYHFYAHPTVVGEGPESLELTIASSRWGEAYAASHAQLSLIGWGEAGGHWQQTALGAFGESITYDPDKNLGRALVDDVRPFLVTSGAQWDWTGNVGGADFLVYATQAQPYWVRRLERVRSHVRAPGPNLVDVRWTGVSSDDGRIEADIRLNMGATDDLVRAWYTLDYTFTEDVPYDRLAFFQVAADNYSDNGFTSYAWNDANGVIQTRAVPATTTPGYATTDDRGIPLNDAHPWVMLYGNQLVASLSETEGDVGFIVREFEANIGGVELTTPHINIRQTNNWNVHPQVAFELGLPHETGSPWCGTPCNGQTRFVPAGSTVHAVVEYVIPPSAKAEYYGDAAQLLAIPDAAFGTPDMMVALAEGNDLDVTVTTGTLDSTWPLRINAASGAIAAEVEISSGFGRVPLTIAGLPRYDGWELQQEASGSWIPVDMNIHGNDSWQATFDPTSATWALTWALPTDSPATYRLVWMP
ncbi:MAG: hypothetical protein ACON4N_13110 [Myxococcota bacterium]